MCRNILRKLFRSAPKKQRDSTMIGDGSAAHGWRSLAGKKVPKISTHMRLCAICTHPRDNSLLLVVVGCGDQHERLLPTFSCIYAAPGTFRLLLVTYSGSWSSVPNAKLITTVSIITCWLLVSLDSLCPNLAATHVIKSRLRQSPIDTNCDRVSLPSPLPPLSLPDDSLLYCLSGCTLISASICEAQLVLDYNGI